MAARGGGVLIGFCMAWLIASSPAMAQRVALVIGNAAYQSAASLTNPVADARGVSAALRRLGFSVDLVTDGTRRAKEEALRRFGRTSDGAEIALLFYAGHGMQIGSENWLVPVDARLADARDAEFELIGLSTVLRQMERARTRIVILDACRNNPMAAQMRGLSGGRSVERGLARVDAQDTGTLIAFSTSPGAVADDGTGTNSPFTAALLRRIEQPGLDLQLILRQVRSDVRQATGGRQTPWENSSLEQEVVLRPASAPVAARPPAPAPVPPAQAPAAPSPPGGAAPAAGGGTQPPVDGRSPAESFVLGLLQPRPAPQPPPAAPTPALPATLPTPRPGAAAAVPFRCPPSGLRVVYDGTAVTFLGTDANDPVVCLRAATGGPQRLLYGFFLLPGESEAAIRTGLAALWPAVPGGSASFQRASGGGGTPQQWRESFRVTRREQLVIGGEARDTLVIARSIQGMVFNTHSSTELYWLDVETGIALKREVEVHAGVTSSRPYVALRIERR
jgi:hypothetical protein